MRAQHLGRKTLAIALFAASAIALLLFWLGQAGVQLTPVARYKATVIVPDAVHLVPNCWVRIAGVKVGKVTAVNPEAPGRVAVRIELDRAYAPLRRDARVLIGMRTLVGESYLDVDPGDPRAPALPSGGTLGLRHTTPSVQLDDIFAAFDARTRAHLRADLRQLGRGLRGRGAQLNRFLAATRPTAQDGAQVMAILRHEREALSRLVGDVGDVMAAIGDRDRETTVLARGIRVTATAVARRADAVGATIDELPPTLHRLRSTADALRRTSSTATPVVRDLRRTATELPALMRDLAPAARDGRALLAQLPLVGRAGNPLLERLRTFSAAATPIFPALDDSLRQLNPGVRHLRPYSRDLGSFLGNVGAAAEARDRLGNLGRVFPVFWQDTLAISRAQRQLLDRVLRVAGVKRLLDEQVNAYPRPGTIGAPQPLTRAPAPPSADPKTAR